MSGSCSSTPSRCIPELNPRPADTGQASFHRGDWFGPVGYSPSRGKVLSDPPPRQGHCLSPPTPDQGAPCEQLSPAPAPATDSRPKSPPRTVLNISRIPHQNYKFRLPSHLTAFCRIRESVAGGDGGVAAFQRGFLFLRESRRTSNQPVYYRWGIVFLTVTRPAIPDLIGSHPLKWNAFLSNSSFPVCSTRG